MTTLLEQSIKRQQMGELGLSPDCVLALPLHMLDGSQFMSRDAYGRLCTNYGSFWTPQGRSYDVATDDYISVAAILTHTAFCIAVWIKPLDLGATRIFIYSENGPLMKLAGGAVSVYWPGLAGWTATGVSVAANEWSSLILNVEASGANNATLMKNGTVVWTSTQTVNAWDTPTIVVGYSGGVNSFYGIYGEVLLYSNVKTLLERQHIYEETKWRYV